MIMQQSPRKWCGKQKSTMHRGDFIVILRAFNPRDAGEQPRRLAISGRKLLFWENLWTS